MQSDDLDDLAQRTFSKPEPTKKLEENQLVNFCLAFAANLDCPVKVQQEAATLLSERRTLQNLSSSSPKEQQARTQKLQALYERMRKFHDENH